MKQLRLNLVVFLCGAVVMSLELTGSRVVAPFLGTSLYIWTSLIGVILGALSLGYWFGGKLADRNAHISKLSFFILLAGILISLDAVFSYTLLAILAQAITDIRVGAVVASIVLFATPAVFLGIVSPYAVRLSLDTIDSSGKTVGRLYALSTLGSIVGTFATGYVLIAMLGTHTLLYVLALTLVLLSMFLDFQDRRIIKLLVFALLVSLFGFRDSLTNVVRRGVIDIDTDYQRVLVVDSLHGPDRRPVRALVTDPVTSQSVIYLDNLSELFADYFTFFRVAHALHGDVSEMLVLGGGTYTYPAFVVNNHPGTSVDVVEIDPALTTIAYDHFYLEQNARLNIFNEDARTYLQHGDKQYDLIIGDVFRGTAQVPFQLTTVEALSAIKSRLKPGGLVAVNMVGALKGPLSKFFRAQYHTYKAVFTDVWVFAVENIESPGAVQNIALIAGDNLSSLSVRPEVSAEFSEALATRWHGEIPEFDYLLTDDYAPVEHLMHPVSVAMFQPATTR